MPRWLEDLAIDRKLMFIMMLTVGTALVVACLTFVATDSISTYRSLRDDLSALGGIVANNSVSALSFEDAEVAAETLETLASTENILEACLYTQDGTELARYARPGASQGCADGDVRPFQAHFAEGSIELLHPVRFQDEALGRVYLRSDLSRLYARIGPYLLGTLLAVAVSSGIALLLSSRLKNLITAPLLRLAGTVDEVSRSQDYSARVEGRSRDEIGRLMHGFNGMLEQIQLRDTELRKAHDEMEQRVIERTAELEVARDAAQAANRAKSEFLANMSHEIRTPLNAVLGLTEVTLSSNLDVTQRDHLATVRDSADSLLGILNDILDFSKIEAGKLDLERVPFNIFDTIDDTLTSLAIRADQKGLELACWIDPELPEELVGDPGRLRQVITNLVSNAIKFTDRGEVVVRATAEEQDDDGLLLRFTIEDTGIGIETVQLQRLFEAFEQADTSTTRRFGGTGLGLAISQQLVDLMAGRIYAESTPGVGSRFHFTARFTIRERARARRSPPIPALEGTRVLIVDDNATNREILEQITRAKGMRPDSASSADEGLERLAASFDSNEPYQLLLSDVHMPDCDGYGLVERIRADSRFDDLQIIFLTSAGDTGDLERCEELTVAARLVKPVRQSELLQVMNRTLGLDELAGLGAGTGRRRFLGEAEKAHDVPPMHILLVDDSAANRKVAFAVLQGHGHTIGVAENGRQALERLAEHDYDVVLMDVQMPEMDGIEATGLLRERERDRERRTPVIAMTAHALQGDREKCLAAGMDDYVSKPIRRDDLLSALAAVAAGLSRLHPAAAGNADRSSATRGHEENTPNVGWSHLLAQVGGDHEVLRDIVEAHLGEIRDNLESIPALISAGDTVELRRRAHTLKGAMALFGATAGQQEALVLQTLAESGDLGDANQRFDHLRSAVDQVIPHLLAFLEKGQMVT